MSDARECVGCGDFVYPPEEVCKECAYILELEDERDALRAVIRQANRLGVIYEDFDRVVIQHDDIDTAEVAHADVVRRALSPDGLPARPGVVVAEQGETG